jgi:hypothetical protein
MRVRLRGICAPGFRRPDGLLGLPEDRFAPLDLGEDELRPRLPWPVEDKVDRRSPPPTKKHRCLIDDLGVRRPSPLETVAVDTGGRRPPVSGLQRDPALEREPHHVRQPAVPLRVPCNNKQPGSGHAVHAAAA